MAPTAAANSTSNSGIRQLSDGVSVIPASVRADGSVRKEIRVKPGYKPPEDVEVYKNRTAEAWKNRGKGSVPGADAVETEAKPKVATKNAKRREAKKNAAAAAAAHDCKGGPAMLDSLEENLSGETAAYSPLVADPETEKAREARKLAKKLRQARELKEKNEEGDHLLPEQFAKVIKINELIRQLDNLGFDAEGTKKEPETDDGSVIG